MPAMTACLPEIIDSSSSASAPRLSQFSQTG
jgi:hypothetical protein